MPPPHNRLRALSRPSRPFAARTQPSCWVSRWAVLLAAAFAAAAYGTSPLHSLSTGDELIPVLVSTQSMSLFYWGADRFGMLLPFLAALVRDPLLNLVTQNMLCALAAFTAFFAASRFFFGKDSWLLGGAAQTLVALAWPPAEPMGDFMSIGQSFAPSAALLFTGLIALGCAADDAHARPTGSHPGEDQGPSRRKADDTARPDPGSALPRAHVLLRTPRPGAPGPGAPAGWPLSRARVLLGFVLLCLCFWVNVAMFFTALPLALGAGLLAGRGLRPARRPLVAAGVAAGALTVNIGLMQLAAARYAGPDYGYLPLALWPEALSTIAANFAALYYTCPGRNAALLAMALAGGAGLAWLWAKGGQQRRQARLAGAAVCLAGAAALANYAGYGLNGWVRVNHYEGRYLCMVQFLTVCSLCGTVSVSARLLAPGGRRLVALGLAGFIGLAAISSHGLPSAARLRQGLEARLGAYAAQAAACGCTHLAGDYWKVWPLVYMANASRHATDGGMLWGVSYRSENTAPLWPQRVAGPWRVCALKGDPQAEAYLARFGLAQAERVFIDNPPFAH